MVDVTSLKDGFHIGQIEYPKTKATCAQNRPWNGLDMKVFEMG
jgi:hypothetical protein